MPLRIAIAEDNPHLAETLIQKVEVAGDYQVKWTAPNGKAFLEHLERDHRLEVVLMDINMPVMDGIEATRRLKERHPQLKVIMSTVIDEDQYILEAIMAGASGYLLKDEPPQRLHQSIAEVMQGGAPLSPAVAGKALRLIRQGTATPAEKVDFGLTQREEEILLQMSKGLVYGHIAENLCISPATVRKHIENIYGKLQVHNRVEAIQLALKQGLL
jgi:DNA-binding NarL/FixJ family response regulator